MNKQKIINQLHQLKDFFNTKDKWCQTYWAKNKKGTGVNYANKEACSFCLAGAIRHLGILTYGLETFLDEVLEKRGSRLNYILFNDDPKTTYEDVIQLLDDAIMEVSK